MQYLIEVLALNMPFWLYGFSAIVIVIGGIKWFSMWKTPHASLDRMSPIVMVAIGIAGFFFAEHMYYVREAEPFISSDVVYEQMLLRQILFASAMIIVQSIWSALQMLHILHLVKVRAETS